MSQMSHVYLLCIVGEKLTLSLYYRNYMRRGSSSSGDGRRLIFVGTMPDMITINYVKHDHVTGIMKLKKVRMINRIRILQLWTITRWN